MPSWLTAADVLPLAGYTANVANGDRALDYAEALIEAVTDVNWGGEVAFTSRIRLPARTFRLPLPIDQTGDETTLTLTPTIASYYGTSYSIEISDGGLALLDGDEQEQPWDAITWKIAGQRGITTIPEDVQKAASLLAAHFLSLSDPERSRYAGASLGDFAGTMRLHALPVPEAAQLLRRYRREVQASL